jgi:hypothetical protein
MRMYHASDGQAHALSLYVSVIGEMVFSKPSWPSQER